MDAATDAPVDRGETADTAAVDVGPVDRGGDDTSAEDVVAPDTGMDVAGEGGDADSRRTLTAGTLGNGTGTITSTPAGINCGSDCSADYPVGASVTLHAAAGAGSTFIAWSGGGCTGTADCTVLLNDDVDVQASFALNNSVVVTLTGAGTGTVTSAPAGINCPDDCSEAYGPGQSITLTATPGATSTFMGWSGGCAGTGACTVMTDMAAGVVATFQLARHALTVNKAGTGAGTVTSNPTGLNCGATCSASFDAGTKVTLVAAAAAGSTFTGWSDGGCSGTGTCDVPISAAATVTATFALNAYALTVNKGGTGAGAVTSNPAGIDCGATCAANFNFGQSITLTAAPAGGSTFVGWSGADCTGTGTCVVVISAASTVTANFSMSPGNLTVSKAGTGSGTVTSNPAGINCGATCSQPFGVGTSVVLTAAAGTGSTFTGWSGSGCAGTGTCTLAVAAASTVTATFTLIKNTLTVSKAGTGTGTVTSNPAGISCGATCTQAVNYGTSVVLTAVATGGSTFNGWTGGGCAGTGTCTAVMTIARTVTATFTAPASRSCTTVADTLSCTNAVIAEINLGQISAPACHNQCQVRLAQAGATTGCWVLASNNICYCRGGVLNRAGSRPGGACN